MYNNYNPYLQYGTPYQPAQNYNRMNTDATQMYSQPQMQPITKPLGLLGKSVDSVDVVKATDIPLDGSISYFPLTDGSAIVTKRLKADGTSETIVYKPSKKEEPTEKVEYVTKDMFDKTINELNFDELDDLKEEFKDIKKEIKDIKTKLKNKGD